MQRVRLNQDPFQLHSLQHLLQSLDLTPGISGVAGLGNRHAQALGVKAHLGDEMRCAGVVLSNGAPQELPNRFAQAGGYADQGIELFRHTKLGRHPLPQQAFKAMHIQLRQQQAKGGIRWRLIEISAEEAVERLAMAFGESLHADQRALAAENRQDRHQQHPPLRKADAPAHPAVRQRLEKTDQIACRSRLGGGLGSQGAVAVTAQDTVSPAARRGLLGQTSNRPCRHARIRHQEMDDGIGRQRRLPGQFFGGLVMPQLEARPLAGLGFATRPSWPLATWQLAHPVDLAPDPNQLEFSY